MKKIFTLIMFTLAVISANAQEPALIRTFQATYQSYSSAYANYQDEDWGLVDGVELTIDAYDNDSLVLHSWMNQEGFDLSITYDGDGVIDGINGYGPGSNGSVWAYCGPNPDADWDYYSWIYLNGSSWVTPTSLFLSLWVSNYENYYLVWDEPLKVEGLSAQKPGTSGIYDLSGRQLNAVPAKGLYIQGGKKYLAK